MGVAQSGRAQVSKTWCRGFKSLRPCQVLLAATTATTSTAAARAATATETAG